MTIGGLGMQTPHDDEDVPKQKDHHHSEGQDYAGGYGGCIASSPTEPLHERLARHRGHQDVEQVQQTFFAGCASESHAGEHGTPATPDSCRLVPGLLYAPS